MQDGGCGAVWLAHLSVDQEVTGSNPVTRPLYDK